jgi:hypothetical protein
MEPFMHRPIFVFEPIEGCAKLEVLGCTTVPLPIVFMLLLLLTFTTPFCWRLIKTKLAKDHDPIAMSAFYEALITDSSSDLL